MKKEREFEAGNPGPPLSEEAQSADNVRFNGVGSEGGSTSTKAKLELINVTSIVTNGRAVWERDAHVQLILETLVPPEMAGTYHQQAMEYNKTLEVGPLDPEQNKAAAGVGIAAVKGLSPYKLPNPTDDMKDAEATGRCAIYCLDLAGQTLAIAAIYGWTGGTKGSPEAARTDDIIAIVRNQFQLMEPGPKLMAADLNGSTNAFPTLEHVSRSGMGGCWHGRRQMRRKARPANMPHQR
jgi:hypothetical protein